MREIRFHKNVLLFLEDLIDLLIEKEYFSFYDTSVMYMEDIVSYITENIETASHEQAPHYFSRFGDNLYYITYNRNKKTSWYILFEKGYDYYFIRYITNNHVAGQYF